MSNQDDPKPPFSVEDTEEFAKNLSQMMAFAGQAASAYLQPRLSGETKAVDADQTIEIVKTLGNVAEYWISDPARWSKAQASLYSNYATLLSNAAKKANGEEVAPVATPDKGDKRFRNEEWEDNQFFDFVKQFYLISSQWAQTMVSEAETVDEHTRHKADFYVTQIMNAVSPSNFAATNPEILKEAIESKGESLARGMKMLSEDVAWGNGNLKIRQSDNSAFKLGKNLALTPGKVVARNDLCELIQYSPTTEKVLKRPLLIVPPWINKFYILDLTPEKSFISWAVAQGHTVFVVSWVNPDQRQAEKDFHDYMSEGILTSLDHIEQITGEKKVNAIGYCVGGTLLSITLAYMAAKKDKRIATATLFTTQVDFTYAGDLQVFADAEQITSVEERMKESGVLDGQDMATAFNMLRSNDLVWPYVINNYLKGKEPFPFDLLYWNSDSTRLPAANHSFYLRNCYIDNTLTKGEMMLRDQPLDLKKVTIPIYNLATKEDHIAPAKSILFGSQYFGGEVNYVLSGSGHIAGVVNPPVKKKYQFWKGGIIEGSVEDFIASATETPGSWWPDWHDWIRGHNKQMVKARDPEKGPDPVLGDAPGTYVTG